MKYVCLLTSPLLKKTQYAGLQETTSHAIQLAHGWQTLYTPEGHAYYYNEATQETTWHPPHQAASYDSGSYLAGNGNAQYAANGSSYHDHSASCNTAVYVGYNAANASPGAGHSSCIAASAMYSAANRAGGGYSADAKHASHMYSAQESGSVMHSAESKSEGKDEGVGGLAALAAYDDDTSDDGGDEAKDNK
jgi:hypothetical protein